MDKAVKELYEQTLSELRREGVYYKFKEQIAELYAQSMIDWRGACVMAKKHGEVNESKNGMTQVNAYHTMKSHYSAQADRYLSRLFTTKELDKIEKPKKKTDKDISDIM